MYARQEPQALQSTSSAFSLASKSSSCLTPSSSRYLSPNVCEDAVKKMQTTVAILEENPHKFKIMPLKQVPASRRPDFSNSPSLNFERPYTGWRPEPPTMYQLTPSRSVSVYSFTSLKDGTPSQSNSPQPSPGRDRSPSPGPAPSFGSSGRPNLSSLDTLSGLGLNLRGLNTPPAGPSSAMRSPGSDQALTSYFDRAPSKDHSSSNPDLTFGTSSELSGTPSLETPVLNPSFSSDSVRKAKSMHISRLRGVSGPRLSNDSDTPDAPLDALSMRRMRSKTVSEAQFARTNATTAKGRLHKQRRHAIYADSGMHIAFSPPKDTSTYSDSPSVAVIVTTSEGESAPQSLSPPQDDSTQSTLSAISVSGEGYDLSLSDSKASLNKAPSLRSILRKVDTNTSQGRHLDPWTARSLPSLPRIYFEQHAAACQAVLPLSVTKPSCNAPMKSSASYVSASKASTCHKSLKHHPIVAALLRDVDVAIQEWQNASRI